MSARLLLAAGLAALALGGCSKDIIDPARQIGADPYLPDFLMCRAELADVLLDGIWSAYRDR